MHQYCDLLITSSFHLTIYQCCQLKFAFKKLQIGPNGYGRMETSLLFHVVESLGKSKYSNWVSSLWLHSNYLTFYTRFTHAAHYASKMGLNSWFDLIEWENQ